jgi:hypothetical protein
MIRIVNRKRYNTETATLIASDAYWDGHNFERHGRNSFLYHTPNGAYFSVNLTMWQGEQDSLAPLTQEEALELYEGPLSEHEVTHKIAFPDVVVEDA